MKLVLCFTEKSTNPSDYFLYSLILQVSSDVEAGMFYRQRFALRETHCWALLRT